MKIPVVLVAVVALCSCGTEFEGRGEQSAGSGGGSSGTSSSHAGSSSGASGASAGGSSGTSAGGSSGTSAGGSSGTSAGGSSGTSAGSAGSSATGGAGGSTGENCEPVPAKATWSATASEGDAELAVDLAEDTYWSSNVPQDGDEWIKVDLGALSEISTVVVSSYSAPVSLAASVAVDEAGPWVLLDAPASNMFVAEPPVLVRYVLVSQVGQNESPWEVWDIEIWCGD